MSHIKHKIGFAGLGAMGGGMAKHLVSSGYTVTGYDLYKPLVDSFAAAGGHAASTPKQAATDAQIFISMVANAAQNSTLLFDGEDCVVNGLPRDAVFMLCSTTPPAFLHELRSKLDGDDCGRPDIKLLDCPVSGGTLRAANGSLSVFAAGEDEHLASAEDVLQCLSGNLYRMGELSNGTKTKTIHQLLAATNIISAAEAVGLAATVGLNTQMVVEHVNLSDGASFMFENRTPHMLQSDWHAYSALAIILKDAGIVTATARQINFPTPLASTAEQLYLQGVQAGLLKDDDAKLVQLYLPKAQGNLVEEMIEVDIKMTASYHVSKETIADLLAGIHLAASMECLAFCVALGMNPRVMFEIIVKAAGWNAMFEKCVPGMMDGSTWSLQGCAEAAEVRKRLADAVAKCQQIKYSCPMASAALQQFDFALLAQKKVSRSDHKAR